MVSNTLFRFLAGVIMAGVKSNRVYFLEGKCCTGDKIIIVICTLCITILNKIRWS